MERICSVGFPVYDLGHVGVMYGDHDRSESHHYSTLCTLDSPLIPDFLLSSCGDHCASLLHT